MFARSAPTGFARKAMRDLKIRVDEPRRQYVDRMVATGPECDFVQEVAVNYPLYVVLSLLGLPESDFPRMLKLTQEMFGGDDAEFQRGNSTEDILAVLVVLPVFLGPHGLAPRIPRRTWPPQSPTRRSTENRCPMLTPVVLRDRGQCRPRHHRVPPSPADCLRFWRIRPNLPARRQTWVWGTWPSRR